MNSFIGWVGGKRLLRNKIVDCFPDENSYTRYVEVFGGAGWVLFAKDKHASHEVFNDINSNLINLYRCVKYHYGELQRQLDNLIISREIFEDFKIQMEYCSLTDIQKAARYLYLLKTSFGSKGKTFSVLRDMSLDNTTEYLEKIHERLKKVTIENRDFEKIIKQYDREETLFYLDPPYLGSERQYDIAFSLEDHNRLFKTLKNMRV